MSASEWVGGSAVIIDPTGLHARPAVQLTKLAKRFAARIELQAEGGEQWINAKSPNAVMKLKARTATRLAIRAEGDDATDAVAAIEALIAGNFGQNDAQNDAQNHE